MDRARSPVRRRWGRRHTSHAPNKERHTATGAATIESDQRVGAKIHHLTGINRSNDALYERLREDYERLEAEHQALAKKHEKGVYYIKAQRDAK